MQEKPDAFIRVFRNAPAWDGFSWEIRLRWGITGPYPVSLAGSRNYKTTAAARENAELWARRLGIELKLESPTPNPRIER